MSEMTPDEFRAIWESSSQQPLPELEYRLYYDENGFPLFYSTEDLPGLYVKVDQQTFLSGPKSIRVIDGKIVETKIAWTKKLIPATHLHQQCLQDSHRKLEKMCQEN